MPPLTQCPTLLAAGDRLHFGLAVEQAKAEGLKVDMLVVGDDCALASKHLVGRRGVAGTVLVLKASWCPMWVPSCQALWELQLHLLSCSGIAGLALFKAS